MENEFVTYTQALVLKEIGYVDYSWFGSECSLYKPSGKHTFYMNGVGDETYISAPLKQQVFRWFRNEHQIEVTVACYYSKRLGISYEERLYHCHIIRDGITTKGPKFKTYEEGESACIDKLIEIVKKK